MRNLNFEGQFSGKKAKVEVIVDLFQFEEDGVTIIYSPSFYLSGYGKDVEEAKQSWETTMEEFLRYTMNKNTFFTELEKLGWKSTNKKQCESPNLADLITKRDYLAEILNEKNFTKFDQRIAVPC